MRDDERLFVFAIQFFIVTILLVAVFHTLFDSDDKKLRSKNREIVLIEQDLANAETVFARMVQPDALRPVVTKVFPSYRTIGTGQTVNINSLK